MNNVININREGEIPDDLMSFDELRLKHGFKYGYLYKHSCQTGEIQIYPRGVLKLSESEVLEFEKNRALKKYGRNK
jgi:hypothetical protein